MHMRSLLTKFLLEHPDWYPELDLLRDDRIYVTGLRTAGGFLINLREAAILAMAAPMEPADWRSTGDR